MDRNTRKAEKLTVNGTSLSARRAWIEISMLLTESSPKSVALRKESVDRNRVAVDRGRKDASRSPQGERG